LPLLFEPYHRFSVVAVLSLSRVDACPVEAASSGLDEHRFL